MATNSPASTKKLTPASARVAAPEFFFDFPYCFTMLSTSSTWPMAFPSFGLSDNPKVRNASFGALAPI